MKTDSNWNGNAHFHFKSLLLTQTKQEAIVLASSKLIEATIHLTKRNVLSEVSTTTTSQSRTPLKCRRSGQKGWLVVFHFLSPAFFLGLPMLNHTTACSSSYTARDDNVKRSMLSFSLLYFKFLEVNIRDHDTIRSVSSKNSVKLYVKSTTQLWRVWKFFLWIFCCTNLYI